MPTPAVDHRSLHGCASAPCLSCQIAQAQDPATPQTPCLLSDAYCINEQTCEEKIQPCG